MVSTATGQLPEVIQHQIEELEQPATVAGPSVETLTAVVEAISETDDTPPVRVLAADNVLSQIRKHFPVASKAAELLETGEIELRTQSESPRNQLFLTEDRLADLVAIQDTAGILFAEDSGELADSAYKYYSDRWTNAEEFNLRTPPISRIREILKEDFGDGFVDDFDQGLESVETRIDKSSFDVVAFLLLLTAKHEELLYDISKLGEDVGVASKATFSRTKTSLEDQGLIGTEKVPIDVGRPRLRLLLGSEELREAGAEELAAESYGH